MRDGKLLNLTKKEFWAYRSDPGFFSGCCCIECRFVSLQLTWNCLTFHLTYRYCVGDPPIMSSTLCQNSAFIADRWRWQGQNAIWAHTTGKSSPVISYTMKPKRTFMTYQKRYIGFVDKNDQLIGDPYLYLWFPKFWEDSNDEWGVNIKYLLGKDN